MIAMAQSEYENFAQKSLENLRDEVEIDVELRSIKVNIR